MERFAEKRSQEESRSDEEEFYKAEQMCRKVLKVKPVIFVTQIGIRAGLDVDKIKSACEKIAAKDPSFKWCMDENNIYIYSTDRDVSYARGEWFKKKVDRGILYRVYFIRKSWDKIKI